MIIFYHASNFHKILIKICKINNIVDLIFSITVKRTEKRKEKGRGITQGATKTESSERTITVGDSLIKYLREYKKIQAEWAMKNGRNHIHNYLTKYELPSGECLEEIIPLLPEDTKPDFYEVHQVFIKPSGEAYSESALRAKLKRLSKGFDFRINFHKLRHTHATRLIESGASIKAVSARLGHSTINTTMNIYVEATEQMDKQLAELFEKIY